MFQREVSLTNDDDSRSTTQDIDLFTRFGFVERLQMSFIKVTLHWYCKVTKTQTYLLAIISHTYPYKYQYTYLIFHFFLIVKCTA